MTLLILFALLSGALTALSPCVLPVLPALLGAGATGGRRRPLGIVLGHTLTFTVTIVGLASVVDGVGLGTSATRWLAVFVLLVFGLALIVPAIAARLEAPLAALSRLGPRTKGDGFWSGIGVGAALGFVYAPCAGPILAAVITVGAASGATVAIGLAYALGSAVVLLALMFGGRRVMERVRAAGRGPALQRALGVVMVLTAIAVATSLDVRFQTAIASGLPKVVVNPTRALEASGAAKGRLADLRGKPRFDGAARRPAAAALPVLGPAPDFVGNQRWFNSRPLSLSQLRGRVVLVDFWTYTCINCIRTFPALKAWDARYRRAGLTIVGVHSPEFAFEKDADNVRDAIAQNGLRYPVAQDNDMATWNAWGNQYWPASYLIDATGQVRYTHFGEGDDAQTEAAIRALLAESGSKGAGGARARAAKEDAVSQAATPETYLGAARAERFVPASPRPGTRRYRAARVSALPQSSFSLGGTWKVDAEAARAVGDATLSARVVGKKVFLVLGPRGGPAGSVRVFLDGKPIGDRDAGADVRDGLVRVDRQRLYGLVDLDGPEEHVLSLRFERGVAGYAFTFG
jgi:cytochrome c biogenesis protein CcdA/thiol-disulfide isomerase/thioredoxin